MKMLSSFSRDKHEFCLVVIKFKHVCSCLFCVIECESIMTYKGIIYKVKRIGPRTEENLNVKVQNQNND